MLKGLGGVLTISGGLISTYDYINKEDKTTMDHVEYGADIIMTGVTFVPPFGWIASSVYFSGKEMYDHVGTWTQEDYDNFYGEENVNPQSQRFGE